MVTGAGVTGTTGNAVTGKTTVRVLPLRVVETAPATLKSVDGPENT